MEELISNVLAVVDSIVELYLSSFIKPFLTFHEKFYNALNQTLRRVLDDNKAKIPDWFTANFITYLRTVLVVPTLLLLAWNYTLLPCLIVILVDFGDFLDGVVVFQYLYATIPVSCFERTISEVILAWTMVAAR